MVGATGIETVPPRVKGVGGSCLAGASQRHGDRRGPLIAQRRKPACRSEMVASTFRRPLVLLGQPASRMTSSTFPASSAACQAARSVFAPLPSVS